MTAKECLIREERLKEGQIEVTVIGIEERSGKVIEKMEKKRVRLTIDNGIEDLEDAAAIIGTLSVHSQRDFEEGFKSKKP